MKASGSGPFQEFVMRDPAPPVRLHVRCLRPFCGHEALLDPVPLFGAARDGWPPDGLSRRFVCGCGGRAAHVSRAVGRADRDNPCGWL